MHVLIIPSWYPAYPGDVRGNFFREQAIALRKLGCKVGVIYPQLRPVRQWRSIFQNNYSVEVNDEFGVRTYRKHGMNWFPRLQGLSQRAWLKAGLELAEKYIKENGRPDIVHAHSIFNGGFLAAAIKAKYSIPFAVTEHSTAYARRLISADRLQLAAKVAQKAGALIAVSSEFCQLLDHTLNTSQKWRYIPNVVNDAFFLQKEASQKSKTSFKFINIALADKKKNQRNLIIAFAAKFSTNKNVRLLIGGDGPELNALRQLAVSLGIADQVELPGRLSRNQVLIQMNQADAFVLSSNYETFGVVLIEALALGLPVIATRCGGPESIIREEDGLLVPVDDVESLGAAMEAVFENQDRYDPSEIRQACRDRFSEEIIARRLINLYTDVCSAHGASSHAP